MTTPTPRVPNRIPVETRLKHALFAMALVAYGSYALWIGELYVPARRNGVHLVGMAAVVMLAAIITASAVLLSTIVDHYDRRDNERTYRRIVKYGQVLAWTLFVIALVVDSLIP